MALTPLGTHINEISCPHCHALDVLQVCALRNGIVYHCDVCGHRWEDAAPPSTAVTETATIRITVSTGFGADLHRLTVN